MSGFGDPPTEKLNDPILISYHSIILRRFSNQVRTSGTFVTPNQIRIATMMAIQIKKRHACLMIVIIRNIAKTAAIIKNIGELMNSGITDLIPCQSLENTRF